MPGRPRVVVFDVNQTLSDMAPMSRRFEEVGLPGRTATLWFASLLRDGFALTAAGGQERFTVLAEGALRAVLAGETLDRAEDDAVEHILAGMAQLRVHDDVPEGTRRLRHAARHALQRRLDRC
jgi:2-haloacid dehalogenase